MTFEEAASRIAERLRASGRGFRTIRREDLRDEFGIGKLTENQSSMIVEALDAVGVALLPHPTEGTTTLRFYDKNHLLGHIAIAVADPDNTTDAPLRRASETFARELAGKEMRSDDVPWIDAFDIFLQLVAGREPEGWEDLRDDRHPSMLARELNSALGMKHSPEAVWIQKIAAAACAHRPRSRQWDRDHLGIEPDSGPRTKRLVGVLEDRDRRLREEHATILRTAASLFLSTEEIPQSQVELGVLGMRRRREEQY